jgi:flagellar M-ring protein FliF
MVENLRDRMAAMPPGRRNTLLASVAFLVAAVAAMVWYAQRPDWKVLFNGLDARDAAQVTQELTAAGVPNRISADGSSVEVPSDAVDKARIEVAAKGMPQSGRMGFELFDKPNWVGSEFDERVNYQRALEGELEHTIQTLGVVRSARVHLVLPQPSLFSAQEKVAKASVVLKLRKPELPEEQVESIRRLVAGAVENLSAENVTLVDADGRLDLQAKDQHAQQGDAAQALEAKLVAMLEPTVGVGNVRAIVNTEYDDGAEEKTDEVYDPSLTATTSIQRTEQLSGAAVKPSGVPGTASNTPAAAPVNAVQGSAAAAAPGVPPLLQPASGKDALPVYPDRGFGQNQSIKEESGTYAVTKHTLHREDGPGRLKRVTVAVVVNDRMTMEGAGKLEHMVWKSRSTEEMHRLEGLAQAAVGYDLKRGDSVVVENVGFSSNVTETPPAGVAKVVEQAKEIAHQEPGMLRAGMMALLGMLVVVLVLRPVAKQVVMALEEPKALPAAAAKAGLPGAAPDALTAGTEAASVLQEADEAEVHQKIIEDVLDRITRKPVQSTKLVEQWINGPQETS